MVGVGVGVVLDVIDFNDYYDVVDDVDHYVDHHHVYSYLQYFITRTTC